MIRTKLAVALCMGLVMTVVFFGPAAPAMGDWMVNGTTLTGTAALATTAAVDENITVKSAGITSICQKLSFLSPLLGFLNKPAMIIGSIIFNLCSANSNCTIPEKIETTPVLADPALDGGSGATFTVLPQTKTTLATIKFNGAECALLGTQPMTGQIRMLAPLGKVEQTTQLILSNVNESTGELKIGSSATEFKAGILVKAASGQPWSFL